MNNCFFLKKTGWGLLLWAWLCAGAYAHDSAPNTLCPVMRDEHINKKLHTQWKGREVYFCCRSCLKRFKKNPDKYIVNL